jgi:hypothetical protein
VLGLLETEFRRHLSEATISAEVFEDLDTERRAVAVQHNRLPKLDLSSNSVKSAIAPILKKLGIRKARSRSVQYRSYLAYPGEQLDLRRRMGKVFYVLAGVLVAGGDAGSDRLEEGAFFSAEPLFADCRRLSGAKAEGYAHLIVFESSTIHLAANDRGGKDNARSSDSGRTERRDARSSATRKKNEA